MELLSKMIGPERSAVIETFEACHIVASNSGIRDFAWRVHRFGCQFLGVNYSKSVPYGLGAAAAEEWGDSIDHRCWLQGVERRHAWITSADLQALRYRLCRAALVSTDKKHRAMERIDGELLLMERNFSAILAMPLLKREDFEDASIRHLLQVTIGALDIAALNGLSKYYAWLSSQSAIDDLQIEELTRKGVIIDGIWHYHCLQQGWDDGSTGNWRDCYLYHYNARWNGQSRDGHNAVAVDHLVLMLDAPQGMVF